MNPGARLTAPLQAPPLKDHANELRQTVDEYGRDDDAGALDAPLASFTNADRAWVLDYAASSLSRSTEDIDRSGSDGAGVGLVAVDPVALLASLPPPTASVSPDSATG